MQPYFIAWYATIKEKVAKHKTEKQLHVDNVLRTPEGRKVEIILTKLIFSFKCSSLFLFFPLCPQKLLPLCHFAFSPLVNLLAEKNCNSIL